MPKACEISTRLGVQSLLNVQFTGEKGYHIVFEKICVGLDSAEFSLLELSDFCKQFALLTHLLNLKVVLINVLTKEVEFIVALPQSAEVEERIKQAYQLSELP